MSEDKSATGGVPVPHEGQKKLLSLPGRYRVAVCGRRFGKTIAAAIAAVQRCSEKEKQRVWWISPVQEQSDRVEREVAAWVLFKPVEDANGTRLQHGGTESTEATERRRGKGKAEQGVRDGRATDEPLVWKHLKSEHALICSNESRIEFKSAHLPDNLRGAGLDLLVVDEAADVSDYTWKMVLKPMLLDSRGEAFILGTPRGTRNWLHRVYVLGQEPDGASGYASLQLATNANPAIRTEDVEEFRREMSEDEFRQEFEAQFIDGVNAAFTRIDEAIDGERLFRGVPGFPYITGIDLGQRLNFSVLCSLNCRTKRVEGFGRFNKMEWDEQRDRIAAHLEAFPGPCVIDETGIGGPVVEMIEKIPRVKVERFLFTPSSRREIITGLSCAFSHREIKLTKIPELINELKAFALNETRDALGTVHYNYAAPEGVHDDCVMALAMAWWGFKARGLWSVTTGNPLRDGMF
ncbi:MAG TPA: terminase family protein [Planctomycetota bacterium]|nr:terminase family protein [Planctomycetota bacterium]